MGVSRRAVFVILVRDGKVLFVRHTEHSSNPPGTYGLPGGRIETDEDPREAAARETLEETGLIARPTDFIDLGEYSTAIETKRGMEPWTVNLYLCQGFDGEIRQGEKEEEPASLRVSDIMEGKYRMARMSSHYLAVLMRFLRDQMKTS